LIVSKMIKETVRDDAPKQVKHLQFGVLSPHEIMGMSEFEAVQSTMYTAGPERSTTDGGVLDKRLGSIDKSKPCQTCGAKMADCVGHYSYIKLVVPVFHIGYFKQTIMMLQDICKSCSCVLLTAEERRKFLVLFRKPNLENMRRQKLAKDVNKACRKQVHCPHCGAINGTVKKVGGMKIIHEKWRAKKVSEDRREFEESFAYALSESKELKQHMPRAQEDLNPLKVLGLFNKITATDCELLGLDPEVGRPEEFLWTYVPVPPVCIRPSVA